MINKAEMISFSDVIHFPFTPDLSQAGITHTLRSLPNSFLGNSYLGRLRRSVAHTAVELAFRRYLSGMEIPYEVMGAIPFSKPDRYDVSLGGHRCHLKVVLLSDRRSISGLSNHPEVMLDWSAVVASDEHASDGHKKDDVYIFAFLTGLTAASQDDLKKMVESGQPHYLIHVMKDEWRRPRHWNPLGPLALKSESDEAMLVEVHGQDERRDYLAHTYHLPPKTKFMVKEPFYSVTSLHMQHLPIARLGIHGPGQETQVIGPRDWGNIWVHGMDIYLTGYVSYEEFRRCARPLKPTTQILPSQQVSQKSLCMPISQLKPLGHLFEMAREWEKRTRNES